MGMLDSFRTWNSTRKSNNQLRREFNDVTKALEIAMDGIIRPLSGESYNTNNLVYPRYPYGTTALYELAYNSDCLTAIHNALKRELFRNKYDLIDAKKVDETETTSSKEEQVTGMSDKEILEKLECINENQQSLIDVLAELEDDFSIMDDAFLVFIMNYTFGNNGKLTKKSFDQCIRGDPKFMGLIVNKYDRPGFNDNNEPIYVCAVHRSILLINNNICPVCGRECFQAYYFNDFGSQKIYYWKDEVAFKSKYRPSKRRGYSPILTCWQKVRTLLFMDKYIMQLYDGQRPPKAGLFFKTSNQDGLTAMIDKAKTKIQSDPHFPFTLAVPDTSSGKDFVQFIDFMKSLDEMQYVEARNEMRQQIGAYYGVSPVFQNDTSTSGGLNNEGLQFTVTNRAVEYGQSIHNDFFIPRLLKAMGVTGKSLRLSPSEEKDEMALLQRQELTLANGEKALALGLECTYDDDKGQVIIKPGNMQKREVQNPFGQSEANNPDSGKMSGSPDLNLKSDLKKNEILKSDKVSDIAEMIKGIIANFLKKYKRKPSERELQAEIIRINKELEQKLKEQSEKVFKDLYREEMNKASNEIGLAAEFGLPDEEAIKAILNQPVLSDAYAGVSKELIEGINKIIEESFKDPKGLTPKQMTDKIKEVTNLADSRAENIARTESGKISTAARYNSYKKTGRIDTMKFRHIGPLDSRTTPTCKRIMEATKDGVSWDDYVAILEAESKPDFPEWTVNKEFPVAHFSCRHIPLRIVK